MLFAERDFPSRFQFHRDNHQQLIARRGDDAANDPMSQPAEVACQRWFAGMSWFAPRKTRAAKDLLSFHRYSGSLVTCVQARCPWQRQLSSKIPFSNG